MKAIIQRVKTASVHVDQKQISHIDQGMLVLLGFHIGDTQNLIEPLIQKILHLRIFSDENDKMNLSLQEVQGEILLVSQFTLYGDCAKGRRPSFLQSAPADQALSLYQAFITSFKKAYCESKVKTGEFGANMQVSLINDGPVTFVVEVLS